MRTPLERLKQLPWLALLQVALLTTIAVSAIEYSLFFLAVYIPAMQQVLQLLGSLAFITVFVTAMGVGAIAVVVLERFKRVAITTGSLWGLIGCLAIVLLIVQMFNLLPLGLVGISSSQLIGIVLGVFLKGQPYWKSYRRW